MALLLNIVGGFAVIVGLVTIASILFRFFFPSSFLEKMMMGSGCLLMIALFITALIAVFYLISLGGA